MAQSAVKCGDNLGLLPSIHQDTSGFFSTSNSLQHLYGPYTRNILWYELAHWASGTFEVQVEYLSPQSVISFAQGSWNISRPAYLTTVCGHHAPAHSVDVHGTFIGSQFLSRSAATTRHCIRWRFTEPLSPRVLTTACRTRHCHSMEVHGILLVYKNLFDLTIFMLQHSLFHADLEVTFRVGK